MVLHLVHREAFGTVWAVLLDKSWSPVVQQGRGLCQGVLFLRPFGQNYTPVDADQVMKYAEALPQLLQCQRGEAVLGRASFGGSTSLRPDGSCWMRDCGDRKPVADQFAVAGKAPDGQILQEGISEGVPPRRFHHCRSRIVPNGNRLFGVGLGS